MPRSKKQKRITIADLHALHMPNSTPLEVEYSDGSGYHRAPVVGAWESESGNVVLTVGKDITVPERSD